MPSLSQWEKAAGRFAGDGREGPYEGKWGPQLYGKIAVSPRGQPPLEKPLKCGEASADHSHQAEVARQVGTAKRPAGSGTEADAARMGAAADDYRDADREHPGQPGRDAQNRLRERDGAGDGNRGKRRSTEEACGYCHLDPAEHRRNRRQKPPRDQSGLAQPVAERTVGPATAQLHGG